MSNYKFKSGIDPPTDTIDYIEDRLDFYQTTVSEVCKAIEHTGYNVKNPGELNEMFESVESWFESANPFWITAENPEEGYLNLVDDEKIAELDIELDNQPYINSTLVFEVDYSNDSIKTQWYVEENYKGDDENISNKLESLERIAEQATEVLEQPENCSWSHGAEIQNRMNTPD